MENRNKGDIHNLLKISKQDRICSNEFKSEKSRFRKDIGKYWLGNRVVDEWKNFG